MIFKQHLLRVPGLTLPVSALLLAAAASAQTTSYTGTGWVHQVLAPGIFYSNAAGQVLARASVQILRVECTDPRVTGRRTLLTDGYYQADGSLACYGAAYHEIGTWSGTNFLPSGGIWETTWRGPLQPDNRLQSSIMGYGSGGTIDSWRLAETQSRAAAANPYDPSVPILYAGTIEPPPVSNILFTNDFGGGAAGWTLWGTGSFHTNNQQLVDQTAGTAGSMNLLRCPAKNWSLADGQTLECQADLAGLTANDSSYARLWVGNDDSAAYELDVRVGGAGLFKWTSGAQKLTCFWFTNSAALRPTNATLHLALTRAQGSVLITTRVLDKANANAALLEYAFTDTAGVDPSLTTSQFTDVSGITMFTMVPDSGPPLLSGTVAGVGMAQFAAGPVQTAWENFAFRLHDVPPLSIARAVQVSWPAPAGVNYSVQSAPTAQGPWATVQGLDMTGIQRLSVPAGGPSQFFRLVQSP